MQLDSVGNVKRQNSNERLVSMSSHLAASLMHLKTRRLIAIFASLIVPLPVFLVEVVAFHVAFEWYTKAIGVPLHSLAGMIWGIIYLALPTVAAIVGFIFVPVTFGLRWLWLGLVFVPLMAITLASLFIAVIGATVGFTPHF